MTRQQTFWNDVFRVRPGQIAWPVATRIGIALAVPVAILVATGHGGWTLYTTFGAFAAVYGREPDPVRRVRTRARAAAGLVACATAGTAVAVATHREWLVIPVAATAAVVGAALSDRLAWQPPGALFFVFAVGGCASVPVSPNMIPVALCLAVAAAMLAICLDLPVAFIHTGHAKPTGPGTASPAPGPPVSERRHEAWHAGARCGLAVLIAGIFSTASGWGHPYWAMVAAAATTAGATAGARLTRGVQRALGTFAGLAVTAVLLATHPTLTLTIVVVVILQVVAELVMGVNYALGLVFVTPLAILMIGLARPHLDTATLLSDRALETTIGAAAGITLTLITRWALPARRQAARSRPDGAALQPGS